MIASLLMEIIVATRQMRGPRDESPPLYQIRLGGDATIVGRSRQMEAISTPETVFPD